ncbi:hypothetical protein P3U41_05595 [Mammaliicoccus sciuri]|uniref:hypothetical protein n=1 Tax=Mammaliicoccus sciuri TaxID=1296 RepID=UPI002B259A5B|nr:hypothetical protein [Mammaliicoccus sciuri]WQL34242.1 hypothetical protein P3U41_05595 [Mammaliicoccus sciuri]WQL61181.1 hypothetical protein P3T96_05595 [Mammaliicoccus sciuri]
MKLKNLNNYTNQELQDVLTQVKAHLQVTGDDWANVTIVNYQEHEDEERDITHYDILRSYVSIERDTTLEELERQLFERETVIKAYKTKKGLLQALLNDSDVTGSYYRLHTII